MRGLSLCCRQLPRLRTLPKRHHPGVGARCSVKLSELLRDGSFKAYTNNTQQYTRDEQEYLDIRRGGGGTVVGLVNTSRKR